MGREFEKFFLPEVAGRGWLTSENGVMDIYFRVLTDGFRPGLPLG